MIRKQLIQTAKTLYTRQIICDPNILREIATKYEKTPDGRILLATRKEGEFRFLCTMQYMYEWMRHAVKGLRSIDMPMESGMILSRMANDQEAAYTLLGAIGKHINKFTPKTSHQNIQKRPK